MWVTGMQFDSFQEFMVMGGHGPFVWVAYLAFVLVIVGSFVTVRLQFRAILTQQRRLARLDDNAQQRSQERV